MDNEKAPKPWWQPALIVFAKATGWIAVPVILALFVGKILDQKLGTSPWVFLGLTVIAFIISMIGIVRETTKEMKKISESNDNNGPRT
jgi:F0F1-type ATP synthase assembly protein I